MVIQRGWKILNDTGSTSASSTEANRSPMGGLNSSSDDSNCSNQTTHSMVTSIASPLNNTVKMEAQSLNASNNGTNSEKQQNQQPHNETIVSNKNSFLAIQTFYTFFSLSNHRNLLLHHKWRKLLYRNCANVFPIQLH